MSACYQSIDRYPCQIKINFVNESANIITINPTNMITIFLLFLDFRIGL